MFLKIALLRAIQLAGAFCLGGGILALGDFGPLAFWGKVVLLAVSVFQIGFGLLVIIGAGGMILKIKENAKAG